MGVDSGGLTVGQQAAASSASVVLASDQAPVGVTLGAETSKVIGTVNVAASQTIGISAGSAVIGHVINDASSAVIGHVIVDTAPSTAVTNAGTFAVQLAANQSVNIAQVNGGTTVASVTGVQNVAPIKRTGATGLAENYYSAHITTKTTTTPTSSTAYLSTAVISCSAAGTAWTLVVKDKSGTPLILIPSFTLTVPTTGLPIILQFEEPILMTGGIDIVTAGTTAGTLDVFMTYWQ